MNIFKAQIKKDIIDLSLDTIQNMKKSMNEVSWNCDIRTSYNLTDNILNIKELWPLKFSILESIHEYMLNNNKFFEGFIKKSWVNIYEKGFYQEFHNHKDEIAKYICGVVYFTPMSSSIEFGIEERIEHKPEVGDILIFNDDQLHRVLPHKDSDLRISLAFNYQKIDTWNGLK